MIFQVRRPWLCLGLTLALLALCAAGLPRLSVNSDTRVFFSEENENRQALNSFEDRYGADTILILALHADEGTVFTEDRLRFVHALTDAAWQLPYSTRVDSITNFVRIASDAEGLIIGDMIPAELLGAPDAMRDRVMDDPLVVGKLVSEDARTTGVIVTFDYPMNASSVTGEILAASKALAQSLGVEDVGFTDWYGGRVASSAAFSYASKTDMKTLTPLSYAVILAFLMALLGAPRIALALFSTVLFAAICALGIAGWAGMQINAASASTPTIIITVGVASLLHFVTSVFQATRAGKARREAIDYAFRRDVPPIALTLATTAVGFLSLNWADAVPFRDVGNLTAAGMAFCAIFGTLWLPALLTLIPVPENTHKSRMPALTAHFAEIVIARRKALLGGLTTVFAVLVAGIALIQVDDDFIRYFDHRYEFRQHSDAIEEHLTGLHIVEFDLGSKTEEGLFDPAHVGKIEAFEAWLEEQPGVHHVASIAEVFRRINQHMNDGDPAFRTVPRDRETLAQYLLLYEMSLPYGQSLGDTVSLDHARSRVSVILRDVTNVEIRAFRDAANAWLAGAAPYEVTGTGTGLAVMFAYLTSLNIETMTGGTVVALVIISFILVGAFRSIRYGAISLVPNLLPVAVAFGIWGYLVGQVGVAVSAVGAATLGIIVDDTIHLLWRYREARRGGATPEDSIRHMFAVVGEPMLVSTAVLVLGFSVVALSGFHITNGLGTLSAITVGTALIADWFLLAPLLLTVDSPARAAARARRRAGRFGTPAPANAPQAVMAPGEKRDAG